jgi:hypothetical protein
MGNKCAVFEKAGGRSTCGARIKLFGGKRSFRDDEEKQGRGWWKLLYILKAVNAWHVR